MDTNELALKLQQTEDRSRRNEENIKKLDKENAVLHQLVTSVAVMAEQLKTMNDSVDALAGKVDALEDKPVKRWDGLVDKAIWAVAAAVIAFLLAKVGL